jgi:hypothetical protein
MADYIGAALRISAGVLETHQNLARQNAEARAPALVNHVTEPAEQEDRFARWQREERKAGKSAPARTGHVAALLSRARTAPKIEVQPETSGSERS